MIPVRRKVKYLKLAGGLFIFVFALLYSHEEVGMSGNESGRFATIQAVAEQGMFYIEKCNFRTVDRTVRNNHVYYDKLPFLPFVLAGVYYPLHRFAKLNFVDNYHLSIYLINCLMGFVVNLLLFLWLFDWLRQIRRGSVELKFLLSIGCVAGSWLLTYSTMLNNHTPAALAVLGLAVALSRFRKRPALPAALLAGCAAGVAGLLELPCGCFFGLACDPGIFCTAPAGKKVLYTASAAGMGALFLLMGLALDYYAYGTVLPLYFGSAGVRGTFSLGKQSAPLNYWYHALIGDRGLFIYTPFLLLAFAGIWTDFRRLKKEEYALLGGTVGFMLFYLLGTNEFGGQSYGLRYFIPVIPLLWFLGARFVLKLPAAPWKAPLLAILILWGVITALAGAYFPFNPGNEGERTPPGHFTNYFSSFGGNLLCWSYERYPSGTLTRSLIERYGVPNSVLYMYWSYFHQKKTAMLARLQKDFPDFFPGGKRQFR